MTTKIYEELHNNIILFGNEYFETFQEEPHNITPATLKMGIAQELEDFQKGNPHAGFYEFLGYLERQIKDVGIKNKYHETASLDDYDISIIMGTLMGTYVCILEQE